MVMNREVLLREQNSFDEFVRYENLLEDLRNHKLIDDFYKFIENGMLYVYNWSIKRVEMFIYILNKHNEPVEVAGCYKYLIHDIYIK